MRHPQRYHSWSWFDSADNYVVTACDDDGWITDMMPEEIVKKGVAQSEIVLVSVKGKVLADQRINGQWYEYGDDVDAWQPKPRAFES